VHEVSSVDVVLTSVNTVIGVAMKQAIPRGYSSKSKFSRWFSYTLRYYIVKKNYFHRHFKNKPSDYFNTDSTFIENSLKTLSSLAGLDN
jgi:hypothetical protein